MQILADEKRRAAKAAKTAAKRAPKPEAVKKAGKKFYQSMLVDSAYDHEYFEPFQAWIAQKKEE